MKKDIIYTIYKNSRTVFRIDDISLLLDVQDVYLAQKLNVLVKEGKLLNLRKGIYAKENYQPEELACILYTPTYISLSYVLARSGVIFQYSSAITNVSYLAREITVENQRIEYRKIKDEILFNNTGILFENNINIASPERAFLDMLYLGSDLYFDFLRPLDKNKVNALLPIYNSKTLNKKIKIIFENDRYKTA